MQTIPSPYNFVPLSRHVFFPDWSAQVSQDVPFSDGLSGWFEIEVKATTPLYIRNGGDLPQRDPKRPEDWLNHPQVQSFFKLPDDRFAIPATSLKGVIRNVLAIASFAKFGPVDRKRYAVRDLHNRDLYGHHLSDGDSEDGYFPKARPGWLEEKPDGSWWIIPCEMARVDHSALQSLCPSLRLGSKQPAAKKYEAWLQGAGSLCVTASIGPEVCHRQHSQPMRYREATNLAVNAKGRPTEHHTLVFTGQPQDRKYPSAGPEGRRKSGGKHMEFLFHHPRRQDAQLVPQPVVKDFVFIHSRPEGGDNDDLKALKQRFWNAGLPMPVFYLVDKDQVIALGLAMMFRLPYRFTPYDLAIAQQPDSARLDGLDLAETVFGAAEVESPLKGRLHFETLSVVPSTARPAKERVLTVLNSPKPTYYPNYLEQTVDSASGQITGDYHTYMDTLPGQDPTRPAARLRGWKRYVARQDQFQPAPPTPRKEEGRENLNIATSFVPLESGACFRGRVHFHNLRPLELGAVLWALTWGGIAGFGIVWAWANPMVSAM